MSLTCEYAYPRRCPEPAVGLSVKVTICAKSVDRRARICARHREGERWWEAWAAHEDSCEPCQDLRYCRLGQAILDAAKAATAYAATA
jgi:hypothetical protein